MIPKNALNEDGSGIRSSSTGTISTVITGTKFEYPESRFLLHDHFKWQLETQGWIHEGDLDDMMPRASIWSREPEPKLSLEGTFRVSEGEDNQFEIEFSMEGISTH